MEFTDLFRPFTEKQKTDSFIYLQNYMLNKINEKEPFSSVVFLEMSQIYVDALYRE